MAKRAPVKKKTAPTTVKSVAFRVSAEYGEWLDRMASHNRTTIAGLLDQALARYARETAFEAPPERA